MGAGPGAGAVSIMLAAGSTGAADSTGAGGADSTGAGGAAGGCWRSDIGGIGTFSRSSGMAGGGMGGCPLISSGPLALLISVAQPATFSDSPSATQAASMGSLRAA